MTWRIEKYSDGYSTTIQLIGRMQVEQVEELQKQLRQSGPAVVLDLGEVTLVDVGVIRFLGGCQAQGAELLNCPLYIREWIEREIN